MTENTPGRIHRRTVVAGAAWTIPVVATAIGAPLAAASGGEPTLAFTNGPYAVAACGTLTDVVITATADGTKPVTSGTPITVTLPSGLKWSDGSTGTKTLFTDGNGQVVLSGVKASGTNGTRTITASANGLQTSAPVTASGATSLITVSNGSNYNVSLPPLPAGVTAQDLQYTLNNGGKRTLWVLGSDGKAYINVDGAATWQTNTAGTATLIATANDGTGTAAVLESSGLITVTNGSNYNVALPPLPAGVTAQDLQYTLNNGGKRTLWVLGSDGKAYINVDGEPTWQTNTAGTATTIAVANGGTGTAAVLESSGLITVTNGSNYNVSLPPLPAGVTAEDLQYTVNNANKRTLWVLGSDGKAYINVDGEPTWQTNTAGTATLVALAEQGTGTAAVLESSGLITVTNGSNYNVSLPPLPAGVTAQDLQYTINNANKRTLWVLGSDGKAYINVDGEPTWQTNTAGTATTIATANDGTGTAAIAEQQAC
ncbi:hypothetical protein [Rathayibacter sp. Leaf248]|uniref:hypothetical protein n=1 Tax=Rathayibacter sp. Leaf248 TaxID=2876555 RepID=UPI001E4830B5|nr:hypothetical protein [Rathayibacter sp. Leaf248]